MLPLLLSSAAPCASLLSARIANALVAALGPAFAPESPTYAASRAAVGDLAAASECVGRGSLGAPRVDPLCAVLVGGGTPGCSKGSKVLGDCEGVLYVQKLVLVRGPVPFDVQSVLEMSAGACGQRTAGIGLKSISNCPASFSPYCSLELWLTFPLLLLPTSLPFPHFGHITSSSFPLPDVPPFASLTLDTSIPSFHSPTSLPFPYRASWSPQFSPAVLHPTRAAGLLKQALTSTQTAVRAASAATLRHLVERNPGASADLALEGHLLRSLDSETEPSALSNVAGALSTLLRATGPARLGSWVAILTSVLAQDALGASAGAEEGEPGGEGPDGGAEWADDDGGIGSGGEGAVAPGDTTPAQEHARGVLARVFALEGLRWLVEGEAMEGDARHVDLGAARGGGGDWGVLSLGTLVGTGCAVALGPWPLLRPLGATLLTAVMRRFGATEVSRGRWERQGMRRPVFGAGGALCVMISFQPPECFGFPFSAPNLCLPLQDPDLPGRPLIEQHAAQMLSAVRTGLADAAPPLLRVASARLGAALLTSGALAWDAAASGRLAAAVASAAANSGAGGAGHAGWVESHLRVGLLRAAAECHVAGSGTGAGEELRGGDSVTHGGRAAASGAGAQGRGGATRARECEAAGVELGTWWGKDGTEEARAAVRKATEASVDSLVASWSDMLCDASAWVSLASRGELDWEAGPRGTVAAGLAVEGKRRGENASESGGAPREAGRGGAAEISGAEPPVGHRHSRHLSLGEQRVKEGVTDGASDSAALGWGNESSGGAGRGPGERAAPLLLAEWPPPRQSDDWVAGAVLAATVPAAVALFSAPDGLSGGECEGCGTGGENERARRRRAVLALLVLLGDAAVGVVSERVGESRGAGTEVPGDAVRRVRSAVLSTACEGSACAWSRARGTCAALSIAVSSMAEEAARASDEEGSAGVGAASHAAPRDVDGTEGTESIGGIGADGGEGGRWLGSRPGGLGGALLGGLVEREAQGEGGESVVVECLRNLAAIARSGVAASVRSEEGRGKGATAAVWAVRCALSVAEGMRACGGTVEEWEGLAECVMGSGIVGAFSSGPRSGLGGALGAAVRCMRCLSAELLSRGAKVPSSREATGFGAAEGSMGAGGRGVGDAWGRLCEWVGEAVRAVVARGDGGGGLGAEVLGLAVELVQGAVRSGDEDAVTSAVVVRPVLIVRRA